MKNSRWALWMCPLYVISAKVRVAKTKCNKQQQQQQKKQNNSKSADEKQKYYILHMDC